MVYAVEEQTEEKDHMAETVAVEEDIRKQVEHLQSLKQQIEEHKEDKILELDETRAQLKDQLQETKARVGDEGKYIQKEANVKVVVEHKNRKKKYQKLEDLKEELRHLHSEEEVVCHVISI